MLLLEADQIWQCSLVQINPFKNEECGSFAFYSEIILIASVSVLAGDYYGNVKRSLNPSSSSGIEDQAEGEQTRTRRSMSMINPILMYLVSRSLAHRARHASPKFYEIYEAFRLSGRTAQAIPNVRYCSLM